MCRKIVEKLAAKPFYCHTEVFYCSKNKGRKVSANVYTFWVSWKIFQGHAGTKIAQLFLEKEKPNQYCDKVPRNWQARSWMCQAPVPHTVTRQNVRAFDMLLSNGHTCVRMAVHRNVWFLLFSYRLPHSVYLASMGALAPGLNVTSERCTVGGVFYFMVFMSWGSCEI